MVVGRKDIKDIGR